MKTSHTPAPWKLHDKRISGAYQVTGEKETSLRIATITNAPNDKANARLIAAAPTLLEAANLAVEVIEKYNAGEYVYFGDAFEKLCNAIAQAESE